MQVINNLNNVDGKLTRSEAGKIGWLKTKELHEATFKKRINDYKNNPTFCFRCGEVISYKKRFNKFCSHSCSAKFNNNKRKLKTYEIKCLGCSNIIKNSRKQRKYCSITCQAKEKNKNAIEQWKMGKNKGYSGKTMLVPPWLRRYLFNKFNSKCGKCGWCEINQTTNKIPLEVNHIDGDATNTKEENLELLCPNCHSLTPNFRALNKKSKRNRK